MGIREGLMAFFGRLVVVSCILAVMWGCTKAEVTEADTERMRREFSQENYERAMKEAGRGAELEEQKKREAEHLQGGSDQQEGLR